MSSKGSARRSCKVKPINVDDVDDANGDDGDDDIGDVVRDNGDNDDDDGSVSGEKDELEADQAVGRV